MKTVKKSVLSMILLSGLFMTACQKSSDNKTATVTPVASTPLAALNCNGAAGCVSQNPALLISASGTSISPYGKFDFAMDFIGDGSRFNSQDVKAVVAYNGPATMSGYVRITAPNFCGLQSNAAGEYLMQATQQGTMTYGVLTNAKISGSGPTGARMEATVSQAVVYNSIDASGTMKGAANNQVRLVLRIDSVNGQPCGLVVYTP